MITITNKNKVSEMIWLKEQLIARYGMAVGLRALKDLADSIQAGQFSAEYSAADEKQASARRLKRVR